MTVVNPKSISGINSITTGSGSDNLLTIHTSDANNTERVRVNSSGDVIVGSGVTLSPDGDVFATGVCTATSFVGDGSGLTNLATDLVNDTSPQLGGDLDTNDFEILLDDNHKIKFGAGNDLTIESDGTHGYIKNHVGGGIYIRANTDIQLSTNASDGGADNAIKCVNNGGIELYYDNTKICETTTNGLALVSGKGIDFSAQSGTASGMASELLDHYEEGTFTPNIQGTGSNNSKTYNQQKGKYTRIGNIVYCEFRISWTSLSADSGTAIVSGLPFVIDSNLDTGAALGSMACNNINFVDGSQVTAAWEAANGQSYIYFLVTYDNGGWSNLTAGAFNNTGSIRGQATYRVG